MLGEERPDSPFLSTYLTIAISTTDARATQILPETLPVGSQWRYLIICQCHHRHYSDKAKQYLVDLVKLRSDVTVQFNEEVGVARSRNSALTAATSPLLLFSDDDVMVIPAGLTKLIAAAHRHPSVAIFAGRTLNREGRLRKRYNAGHTRMTRFNSAKFGTVELAVRPARTLETGVRFDERFGSGGKTPIGDEYVFITDALRAGLEGLSIPTPLAIHSATSSGLDWTDLNIARSRGQVFDRVFEGPIRPLVKLAFLLRHSHRFTSLRGLIAYGRALMSSSS